MNSSFVEEAYRKSVFDKWNSMGFLESITHYTDKLICSLVLEEAANYLIKNRGRYLAVVKTLIFPIIIRIIRSDNCNLEINNTKKFAIDIIRDFQIDYLANYDKFESIHMNVNNMDIEADYLVNYCDNYNSILLERAYRQCKIY